MRTSIFSLGLVFTLLAAGAIDAASSDPVLFWNEQALKAIEVDRTAPPMAARNLAMMHGAIYDAVNSIKPTREAFRTLVPTSQEANIPSAVTAAAHRILTHLYPAQSSTFDGLLIAQYATIRDSEAKKEGIRVGRKAADEIILWRLSDNSGLKTPYKKNSKMGEWNPEEGKQASLPNWSKVNSFFLKSADQFAPPAPPKLISQRYAEVFNDVKSFGEKKSSVRTPSETDAVYFWDIHKATPPGHWNVIAAEMASDKKLSTAQNAHLFAILNAALADASIACWLCKYQHAFWRPVDAIHRAAEDDNPNTTADLKWQPLITTPPHPDYPSGHSTFSGAAATILTAYFGNNVPFNSTVEDTPSRTRSYRSFWQAAKEAGRSRIWGGIHFESANQAGLGLGRDVATYVLQEALKPQKQQQ